MKILITGACGFVGSTLAKAFLESRPGLKIFGLDNFIRPGSELNRRALQAAGVKLFHADIRSASDLEQMPHADWVIDAAATPIVMAGVDGKMTSRQLIEHNVGGTVNILELCKRQGAGLILLSTSRVYSIAPLSKLPVEAQGGAFRLRAKSPLPPGLTAAGVNENFSVAPPVSLYGCSKTASEMLALEYGAAFNFPVWINRCGVLGGAGQFSRPDQGIFSFWLNAYLRRAPLKYIGFGGKGLQVRDCLHPLDLARLLEGQMSQAPGTRPRVLNVGGGLSHAMSLAQLSAWCQDRFGAHRVGSDPKMRPFDIPWMVMDSALARKTWNWKPEISLEALLEEISEHARQNPRWLDVSAEL